MEESKSSNSSPDKFVEEAEAELENALDPVIVEVVFKQLLSSPDNNKCVDCGK